MRAWLNDADSRIHLPSWGWFGAFFFAALETLDARIFYGDHLSPTGLALALAGRTIVGGIVGALVGLLFGAVAIGVETFLPHVERRRSRPIRAAWLIGLAFGLAVGGYNVATSPQKAAHDRMLAACARVVADLSSAQGELDARHPSKAQAYASDALSAVPVCDDPQRAADEAQAHLILANAGYAQNLPYAAEAKEALQLATDCAKRAAAPDDPSRVRCPAIAAGAQAQLTQHFCDASLRLSNDADDSLAHQVYDLARSEAAEALGDAAKCKSEVAYAYRGNALLKRGLADYLGGQKGRGAPEIATGKELLIRCVVELEGDVGHADLRRSCAIAVNAAKQYLGS